MASMNESTEITDGCPRPIFYGLLYVDVDQKRNPNIRDAGDPLDIYLRCASLCARSVAYHGYSFRLVTNEKCRIQQRLRDLSIAGMEILQQQFTLSVPEDVKFRAAHFKLELYSILGSGCFGDHVGVVDIDSVMTGPINFPPLPPGTILGYDITDQVLPEYGRETVSSDLERVSGTHLSECRWLGGEFLFGHAESFRRLADSVFQIWPKYIQSMEDLHHVGDEMLVSASIANASLDLLDAGQLGFVVRWWTARTNFRQMPFDKVSKRSILHLPSDKGFLARFANDQFCPKRFLTEFKRAARAKLFRRKLYNLVDIILHRKRKYVASLS